MFSNFWNSLKNTKSSDSLVIPENSVIQDNVILGLDYKSKSTPPLIGENAFIRSNTVIYNDVIVGDDFKTGHGVVIKEKTNMGDNVLIGTNSIVESHCNIGSNVSIQSNVYLPSKTVIEDYVFIGPCACFTDKKHPIRIDHEVEAPILKKGASIGANSTFLSGVEVGEGAMVAAGANVIHDVPSFSLAIGCPAEIKSLPRKLKNLNKI